MNVKTGTQTWSDAPQNPRFKSDGIQMMSPKDREKVLGDKDLGTHLNQIVDPNWIDPALTRKVGGDELDRDAFLQMFLAQLRNQDPFNPLESHDLAAQLAQFTSLEKLNSIDEGIAGMANKANPTQSFEALNFIGKTIQGDSSKIIRMDEESAHQIEFNLAGNAQSADISIRDAMGREIRRMEARDLTSGPNSITWDGRIDSGSMATPGEYAVIIEAKNAADQRIHAETKFQGKVTGVNFTAQGPVLMLGKQTVRMSDVRGIMDESILSEPNKQVNKIENVKNVELGEKEGEASIGGMGSSLQNIGMSQDLINKLGQE